CFKNNKIEILPFKPTNNIAINVESDWSSASYYYSLVTLSDNLIVTLKNYSENSLQGDSEVASIYKRLGVVTVYNDLDNSIQLKKSTVSISDKLILNLNKTPDIAQTIAVSCVGLGLSCELIGLKTLRIKETDRLEALKTELEKLGAKVEITNESLKVFPSNKIKPNVVIETYQDHRMAMAFAPLSMKTTIVINNPNVVTKSYKTFWEDLKRVGVYSNFK
ncbi:MAG: 3-phosphoshikimate 1-carboxyvinyltransferase, partial [Flavobacteriaceae bacterium]